jgi:hypothetical protein
MVEETLQEKKIAEVQVIAERESDDFEDVRF